MTKYFKDYFWKDGRPKGFGIIEDFILETAFKVISDPYFKWISIEEYTQGAFSKVIYDSSLLKFNHLKPVHQMAWEKKIIEESAEMCLAEIRNQDDRLIFIERYSFQNGLCRSCEVRSPHGLFLATHHMLYTQFEDPINGVILRDSTGRPVMFKRYEFDEDSQQFTDLIEEEWNMEKCSKNLPWLSSSSGGFSHHENRLEESS